MSLALVPNEKTSIHYPEGYIGKYSSFEVGYYGDEAGIFFQFVNAVKSVGVRHERERDIPYTVTTEGKIFNKYSLEKELGTDLPEKEREVLRDGFRSLQDFIYRNGRTNPSCAEDFECVPA